MREAGDGTGQFGPALRPLDNWVRKSPVRLAELEGRKGGNCEAPPGRPVLCSGLRGAPRLDR